MRDRYEKKMVKLNDQQITLKTSLTETQQELSEAEHSSKSSTKWKRDLATMIAKIKGNAELRQRLNSHLKQFIKHTEIFPIGDSTIDYIDSVTAGIEENYELTKAERKELYAFAAHVEQRANTKEGRFVRVVFNTKIKGKGRLGGQHSSVELVPEGSVASLDVEQLWAEYEKY